MCRCKAPENGCVIGPPDPVQGQVPASYHTGSHLMKTGTTDCATRPGNQGGSRLSGKAGLAVLLIIW